MNRQDLLDNVTESERRREVVTLTLHPITGSSSDRVVTGRVALAEHYTGRHSLVVVVDRSDDQEPPLVVGLTMVRDFQVGRPPRARVA